MEYARTHSAPLRSLRGPNSYAYNQMLHDVSAILAYEHPEVRLDHLEMLPAYRLLSAYHLHNACLGGWGHTYPARAQAQGRACTLRSQACHHLAAITPNKIPQHPDLVYTGFLQRKPHHI